MADDWKTPEDPAPEPDPVADEASPVVEEAPVLESTPDYDDVVTVSIPAGALAENGEPLEELSSAGLVLIPGESIEVTRGEALVFDEDERVEVSD